MTAATELMVERGNTDFQMSEVSARCQMSKGALYYYFADKGALVQAIFDASIDDLVNQIEGAVAKASSATESIEGIARVLARGMRPRSPLALAMGQEVSSTEKSVLPSVETRLARIVSIFSAQFDRAKEEGLVRPEVSSHLGAIAIAGAFTFAVLEQPRRTACSTQTSSPRSSCAWPSRAWARPRPRSAWGWTARVSVAAAQAFSPGGPINPRQPRQRCRVSDLPGSNMVTASRKEAFACHTRATTSPPRA